MFCTDLFIIKGISAMIWIHGSPPELPYITILIHNSFYFPLLHISLLIFSTVTSPSESSHTHPRIFSTVTSPSESSHTHPRIFSTVTSPSESSHTHPRIFSSVTSPSESSHTHPRIFSSVTSPSESSHTHPRLVDILYYLLCDIVTLFVILQVHLLGSCMI